MTDYEEYIRRKEEKEKFEESIPEECKKCTLLEKDYLNKTARCFYRSKNRCILEPYLNGEKNEI